MICMLCSKEFTIKNWRKTSQFCSVRCGLLSKKYMWGGKKGQPKKGIRMQLERQGFLKTTNTFID